MTVYQYQWNHKQNQDGFANATGTGHFFDITLKRTICESVKVTHFYVQAIGRSRRPRGLTQPNLT